MAAAAQTAAAAEAAAANLDSFIVDERCRRLETRDTRARRAAARRRLTCHFTRRVLTAFACLGPKARKYNTAFGRSDRRKQRRERASEKWVVLILPMFLLCSGFLILVIRRFRILLPGKTTSHPSG
jgi:hypothetical protein